MEQSRSTTFDTTQFALYKKTTEESLKKRVDFVRDCCEFIVNSLLYTDEGVARINKKMDDARRQRRNGTNIFEAGLRERIITLPSGDLRRVSHHEMEEGHINYIDMEAENSTVIKVNDRMGISIVDLIKGPRNDPYWMRKNNVKTIPELLEEVFQDKTFQDIKEGEFSDEDPEPTRDTVMEYMSNNNITLPLIYYHYNSRWGPGGKGKFAIELDWSGESPELHSGFRAGSIKPKQSGNSRNGRQQRGNRQERGGRGRQEGRERGRRTRDDRQ